MEISDRSKNTTCKTVNFQSKTYVFGTATRSFTIKNFQKTLERNKISVRVKNASELWMKTISCKKYFCPLITMQNLNRSLLY